MRWSKLPPLLGDELAEPSRALFKSRCMRLQFIALDRPEIQFVAKELAQTMATPTVNGLEHLKSVARFLRGRPTA
eukprot:12415923-Karenia_brevis.AAC.1